METPNLPAICALRPAWNKGRIVRQKRPIADLCSSLEMLRLRPTLQTLAATAKFLLKRTHPLLDKAADDAVPVNARFSVILSERRSQIKSETSLHHKGSLINLRPHKTVKSLFLHIP